MEEISGQETAVEEGQAKAEPESHGGAKAAPRDDAKELDSETRAPNTGLEAGGTEAADNAKSETGAAQATERPESVNEGAETAEGPKSKAGGIETAEGPKPEAGGIETAEAPKSEAGDIETAEGQKSKAGGKETAEGPKSEAGGKETAEDPRSKAGGIETAEGPKSEARDTDTVEGSKLEMEDTETTEVLQTSVGDTEIIESLKSYTVTESSEIVEEGRSISETSEETTETGAERAPDAGLPSKKSRKPGRYFFSKKRPSTRTLTNIVAKEMDKDWVARVPSTPSRTPQPVSQEEIAKTAPAPDKRGKPGSIMPAEFIYKPAAAVIQDPTLPPSERPCMQKIPWSSIRGTTGVSNRQAIGVQRKNLLEYKTFSTRRWEVNPTATVPMRVSKYKGKRERESPVPIEDWEDMEERDKNFRDHLLAKELGYETLVGNIKYIDIPGAKDIQRSWLNFLSADVMEWGFPYHKGSKERPRMRQPEVYLAHQVKEKLWRYPRSKMLQALQEESTVP